MVGKTAMHTLIYAFSRTISRLISFLAVYFFARRVGPSHFGVYTYIVSVIFLIIAFADLGMLAEAIKRSKSRNIQLFEHYAPTHITLSFLASIPVFLMVLLRGYSILLALLASLVFILFSSFNLFLKINMVSDNIKAVSTAVFLERLIFSLLLFILPFHTASILLAWSVSLFLASIYLYLNSGIKLKEIPKIEINKWFSLPFFVNASLMSISTRILALIYDKKFGTTSLGNFGIADYINQSIISIIQDSLSFITARAGSFSKSSFGKLLKYSILLGGFSLLVISLVNFALLPYYPVIFGMSYRTAPYIFSILLLVIPVRIMQTFPMAYLYHKNPKMLALSRFIQFALLLISAIAAGNIVEAAFYRVVSEYLSLIFYYFTTLFLVS